ncbi:hypothetical protein SteCoe_8337 [Stentor coeruleus]|uniref:Uncharacterized protein n=1 Tax=Stentor coeruleus TaxID=5963 RepID=A0A1R2CKI8_9CILI|nr:hypothetical protein SteCoe_8337 [Stentor coeruleus]
MIERRKKSKDCVQADMHRSLKIISLRAQRINKSNDFDTIHKPTVSQLLTSVKSSSIASSRFNLGQHPRNNSSIISENKFHDIVYSLKSSRTNSIPSLSTSQISLKNSELKEKIRQNQEKEIQIKELEAKIKKLKKNVMKKSREVDVQQIGCGRIVAEVIVKGIIEDIVWQAILEDIRKKEISMNTRKNACVCALNKMKSIMVKLDLMNKKLKKHALKLIDHNLYSKNSNSS